jgi:integrating conjugative element protein (TIGR03749 family)
MSRAGMLLFALACAQVPAPPVWAQEAQAVEAVTEAIDLGETVPLRSQGPGARAAGAATAATAAQRAGASPAGRAWAPDAAPPQALSSAARLARSSAGAPAAAAPADERVERVAYARRPVRVALPLQRERMISFAGPVALHAPQGIESLVHLQIIGRSVYATALAPFGRLRVVAEDIERDGLQIPLDLVADRSTETASAEIDIPPGRGMASAQQAAVAPPAPGAAPQGEAMGPSADMVALTRHAAQMLYAPTRLLPADPAIRQVPLDLHPVAGLYRGRRVRTTPMGAWRSGSLYVTAVRVTNLEARPLELQLQDLRGQWLAATPQHGRLGPAGSDTDTTAVYLVCDRPFASCR